MEENKNLNENEVQNPETVSPQTSPKKKGGMGIIRIIVLILCIGVFGFSVFKIGSDLLDDSSTGDEYDDLQELAGRNPTTPEDDKSDDPSQGNTENNAPVDPVDPDASGDNQGNTGDNTGDNTQQNPENSTTPENPDSGSENSGNEGTGSESSGNTQPDVYDDQNEEQAAKDESQNQIIVVSRPGASLDKTDLSVIHPDLISLRDIAFVSGIDFKKLQQRNSDTVAWICIPGNDSITGLPVDTAVVQASDNDYYLTHSFDKSENVNGWIYADYRNDMEHITANYNTIIYGHARSYRMFGGLKNLNVTPEWYKNGYNHFIKITTPTDETIWQIFSWHETNVYYNYIQTSFSSSDEFIDFANKLQDKNELKGYFSTFEFTRNSRILTLSTCKGSNPANRVAVHAVLVARNPIK